jgi:hypothetical protein
MRIMKERARAHAVVVECPIEAANASIQQVSGEALLPHRGRGIRPAMKGRVYPDTSPLSNKQRDIRLGTHDSKMRVPYSW